MKKTTLIIFLLCFSKILVFSQHRTLDTVTYGYRNIVFKGNEYRFHLGKMENIGLDSPLLFRNSTFDCESWFPNLLFKHAVVFIDVNFKYNTWWKDDVFNSRYYICNSKFESVFSIEKCRFASQAVFHNYNFETGSNFQGALHIYSSRFDSLADFSYVTFKSFINFLSDTFQNTLSFRNAYFYEGGIFYCSIKEKLDLSNIRVDKKAYFLFNHSSLPDTIDFSYNPNIILDNPAGLDFTVADNLQSREYHSNYNIGEAIKHKINYYLFPASEDTIGDWKKIKINLFRSNVSSVRIDYDHFRFYAYDNTIKELYSRGIIADTNGLLISREAIESIYENLLKNFKNSGQIESYEKLDIEYNRFVQADQPISVWIQDWWWRFGYERKRIFYHISVFILLFSIINYFVIHRLNDKGNGVYHIEQIPQFYAVSKRRWKKIGSRIWYSIVYTSIIFFLLALKIEKLKFSKLAVIWIFAIYITGLICMGFMANLILQK